MATITVNTKDGTPDGVYPVALGDDTVNTADIVDDAVTGAKILDGDVDTDDLADEAVTNAKLGLLSVDTGQLAADAVENSKLADNAVSLENLDSGIKPAFVPVYGGVVTWSGAGASLAHTVTGALDTDIVSAVLRVKGTEPSYLVSAIPSADTVTFTVDVANTSNDTQVDFIVYRAAA